MLKTFIKIQPRHSDGLVLDSFLRYGLKSDVYSMGLICAAMIQALPGNTLLPVAESLNYLTTIGLEALSKPDLEVFTYRQEDPGLLRELKQVITTMLRVSPDERASSAEALPQMESLLKVCEESPLLKSMYSCIFLTSKSAQIFY